MTRTLFKIGFAALLSSMIAGCAGEIEGDANVPVDTSTTTTQGNTRAFDGRDGSEVLTFARADEGGPIVYDLELGIGGDEAYLKYKLQDLIVTSATGDEREEAYLKYELKDLIVTSATGEAYLKYELKDVLVSSITIAETEEGQRVGTFSVTATGYDLILLRTFADTGASLAARIKGLRGLGLDTRERGITISTAHLEDVQIVGVHENRDGSVTLEMRAGAVVR